MVSYEGDDAIAQFAHDAARRLVTETMKRDVGTIETVYRYDAADRIAEVVQSGWGTNYTTTHTYDAATGLLSRRTTSNTGSDDEPARRRNERRRRR